MKQSIDDLPDISGKRVFVRADFNVPVKAGKITDDFRIRSTIPTLEALLKKGAKVIVASHLGRPSGKGFEEEASLKPVFARLQELLKGVTVLFAEDCMKAEAKVAETPNGGLLVLENLRFYKGEGSSKEEERAAMAKVLASYADFYVCDAFGTAHRDAASITGIPKILGGGVAGYLMAKEITYFTRALASPEHPVVAVVGGAKVSDKILLLRNMLASCDVLLIGGAMAYTFLAAKGISVGKSKCERTSGDKDIVKLAGEIVQEAAKAGKKLLLPVDHKCHTAFEGTATPHVTADETIPETQMALDIGPKTLDAYVAEIKKARTVIWNGPMGAFELPGFERGTFVLAQAMVDTPGLMSIVGGGDSASAAEKSGTAPRLSHVSTGGGASLELLEGKILPGVAILNPK